MTTSEILPTVMEGGYGTMSADREKAVSTLVIEDVPFNVSGPGRFDAYDRKRTPQRLRTGPFRRLCSKT